MIITLWLLRFLLEAYARALKDISLEMYAKRDERAYVVSGIVDRLNDAHAGLKMLPELRKKKP